MQTLLTRLANLEFIYEQLAHLKIRFFSLNDGRDFKDTELFKTAYDLVQETADKVMRYLCNKLVYIDCNEILFADLYIGKEKDCKSCYNT